MVLSAGHGTRLRPLSSFLAKPMVPLGDRPAIAHIVERVRACVPARIVVNVHYRPDDVRVWASAEGVLVSEEEELLGTAGGVEHANHLLGDADVLVWNGDIVSDLDSRALVRAHETRRADATLAVRSRPRGEGNVGMNADGRIVRLRAESFGEEVSGGDFVGVHVVGHALRTALPKEGCLVGDVYIPLLAGGGTLAAFVVDGEFHDIGTIASYLAANRAWLRSRDHEAWTADGALVRAEVRGSIIGARARVEAPATNSVVWPDTHVTEAIDGAVATPHGIVRP